MSRTVTARLVAFAQRRLSIVAVVVLLAPLILRGEGTAHFIHYVDNIGACNGLLPCYSLIMDAVNAAAEGDAIEVFPGVYHESVNISRQGNIVLRAQANPRPPVIAPSEGLAVEVWRPGVQIVNLILEGGVGLQGGSSNSVIQGNVIRGTEGVGRRAGGTTSHCTIRNNVVLGGRIGRGWQSCVIEGNTVIDGTIWISAADESTRDNVIRRNVVRGGSIGLIQTGFRSHSGTIIEANFVSGSPGDGIWLLAGLGGLHDVTDVTIRNNTSIDNAGCDINDTSLPGSNIWRNNRFGTQCGDATD